MALKKNQRVYLPGTGERGKVEAVVPKAEGIWAEQFYEVKLDDNDLFLVTIQENGLVAEEEQESAT